MYAQRMSNEGGSTSDTSRHERDPSSTFQLTGYRRFAAASVSVGAFGIAALSELWKGNDGAGTVGFLAVGGVAGLLSLSGLLPVRMWWGDKGFDLAVHQEARKLESSLESLPEADAELVLDEAAAGPSLIRSAAADSVSKSRQELRRQQADLAMEIMRWLASRQIEAEIGVEGPGALHADFKLTSLQGHPIWVVIVVSQITARILGEFQRTLKSGERLVIVTAGFASGGARMPDDLAEDTWTAVTTLRTFSWQDAILDFWEDRQVAPGFSSVGYGLHPGR